MPSPSVKVIEMDRLPIPAEISFIRSKVLEGESLRLGNKSFSKVMTIGVISSCRYVRSLRSVEYVMEDPCVDLTAPKEISVIHREESKDSNESQGFPLGTQVFITGRLTRFKGSVAIQAYLIRELISLDEYDCLKMEAFLAVQYHTKNPSGQTPVRRPHSSFLKLRKSSPLYASFSAPEKRVRSLDTCYTPSPKRSSLPNMASSVFSRRERVNSKTNMSDASKQCRTVKEAGSQDSFEDNVLYF